MKIAIVLRIVAILIAIAGVADPALTVARALRPQLMITVLDTPSLALPDRSVTRRERAFGSAESLRRELAREFDVTIRQQPPAADADPCGDQPCVVISDGSKPSTLMQGNHALGAVKIGQPIESNVAIRHVTGATTNDLRAVGVLAVHLEAHGAIAGDTDIDVFDDNVLVGHSTYKWDTPKTASQTAVVHVEWSPIEEGTRDLRVVAHTSGEVTELDNEAHAAVDVTPRAWTVLLHEAQPSWAATFVRRALSDDQRFRLLSTSRIGNSLSATNTDVRLELPLMTAFDVATIVVSAPQLLSAREVEALDQFARVRGGSVVLMIDVPVSGPLTQLWPGRISAHIESAPLKSGPLQAAEFITFDRDEPGSIVLAAIKNEPVVISRATGIGRIVAFGASDAWRYRDSGNGFATFWQGLIADAVAAAGDAAVVSVSPSVARPGESVAVDLEWRTIDASATAEARAVLDCGSEKSAIRLWPSNGPGRFRGALRPSTVGRCRVRAEVGGKTAMAPLVVTDQGLQSGWDRDELSHAIAAAGGTVVAEGQESALVSALRRPIPTVASSSVIYPMRSPWWIVPFVGCLGAEWWLRRRAGRR